MRVRRTVVFVVIGMLATIATAWLPVFTSDLPPPPPGREEEWAADAREVFDGEILVSHDLMKIGAG